MNGNPGQISGAQWYYGACARTCCAPLTGLEKPSSHAHFEDSLELPWYSLSYAAGKDCNHRCHSRPTIGSVPSCGRKSLVQATTIPHISRHYGSCCMYKHLFHGPRPQTDRNERKQQPRWTKYLMQFRHWGSHSLAWLTVDRLI